MGTVDYNKLYNTMAADVWYLAKDLGVSAASLNAMVTRGMVEKMDTSPRKYRKIDKSKYTKIAAAVTAVGKEFFTAFECEGKMGMLCSIKDNKILDCWGKTYPVNKINFIRVEKDLIKL